MILKVANLDKYEQRKSKPDTRFGADFQGKKLHPIPNMIFWYRWGEYTFDIRAVRKAFGEKEIKDIDMNSQLHPSTKFQIIADEIIKLVGDTPFLKIFDKEAS